MNATKALNTQTHRMVVAIDDDDWSLPVLEHALVEANETSPCELHVVTVVSRGAGDADVTRAAERLGEHVREAASLIAEALHEPPQIWTHVRAGDPAEEIAFLAEEIEADRILVGPPTELGSSVSPKVVTMAACEVHVVRPKDYGTSNAVVCPACAEVRAESGGERWFCAEHAAPGSPNLVLRLPRLDLSDMPTQFG